MVKRYTHEVGVSIRSISGEFEVEKEKVVALDGKAVLYTIAIANMDSSCCGRWGCRYALVQGYVKSYKCEKNVDGFWVSEIETITDKAIQKRIQAMVEAEDNMLQVQFS